MPTVRVYIKDATWSKILRIVDLDHRKASAIVREMVEEKYGAKRNPTT